MTSTNPYTSLVLAPTSLTTTPRLHADVHTHTLFSLHAYSTVLENAQMASAVGLELLGITDHFSAMLHEEQTLKHFQYFINMVSWPRELWGVTLLRGCEADIVDVHGHLFGHDVVVTHDIDGTPRTPLTLKDAVFKSCDYVVASVHGHAWAHGVSRAQLTRMYIAALEDPKVFILGHPGRSNIDFELDPVLEAARDLGKCIELNNSTLKGAPHKPARSRCLALAERASELGVNLSYASDAHIATELANQSRVAQLIEEAHVPAELLVCRSKESFLTALEKALGPLALPAHA